MDAPLELLAHGGGIDCDAYAYNATLGPLGIDYVYFHYCSLAGAPLLSAAALLFWLAVLFFFLGTTADGYFSPTLANISEKLNIPYDIAGVTFLAFGNGAPDVFSAIAAYSSGVGDAGINELLGGAMFVSTVVVGAVAVASPVRVDPWPFTRDVCALLAALALLLGLATALDLHDTHSAPAVLLLAAYALYVGSVLLPECVSRYRAARAAVDHQVLLDVTGSPRSSHALVLSAFWHALSPRGSGGAGSSAASATPYEFITRAHAAQLAGKDSGFALASPKRQPAPQFASSVFVDHFDGPDSADNAAGGDCDSLMSPLISPDDRIEHGVSHDDHVRIASSGGNDSSSGPRVAFTTGASIIESAYWRHLRWRWRVKRRVLSVFTSDAHAVVKALNVPLALLVLVRDVTIPLLDTHAWSRPLATLAPVTVPLFVLLTAGALHVRVFVPGSSSSTFSVPLWQLALAGGIVGAVAVAFRTHRSRPPSTRAGALVFLTLAFASCVCWIYAVANELLALLIAVGVITHASNSLLGLTVLSWGNSVGDLITNVSVARAGFPQMAIAGCFGGPVFNLLLGLGVPMAVALVRGDAVELILDAHAAVSLGFLGVSLAATLVVVHRHGFCCPPAYGRVLMVYYVVYTVVNVAIAYRAYAASAL